MEAVSCSTINFTINIIIIFNFVNLKQNLLPTKPQFSQMLLFCRGMLLKYILEQTIFNFIANQASTISTGLLARRLFVAVGPVWASDTQLLLARTGHKVFFFGFFS